MTINKKSIVEKYAKKYGKPWKVTNIDHEPVAYKDYGDGYEVEISGLHKSGAWANVYVWQYSPRYDLVTRAFGINSDWADKVADLLHEQITA